MEELAALARAVQRNCDIADARHAREASMCTYLLQLREFYQWQSGLPPGVPPPRQALARWIQERETHWARLEGEDYGELSWRGKRYAPFDAEAINEALLAHACVYGAGLGRRRRPHFFLAELERVEEREGLRVLVAGRELARDLAAFPAALQGTIIIVRRDALRRWICSKIELSRARAQEGALARALACWRLEGCDGEAFERTLDAQTEALVLHELGEARAAQLLGKAWETMLAGLEDARTELLARAVRDNLADCLSTLPALLARKEPAPLHLYFSHFEGLRREIFPALAAGYRRWCEEGAAGAIARAVREGAEHWARVARRLVADPARADVKQVAL